MARLRVEDSDLVVRLTWWERVAARRGSVRVPLTAVCRVTVEPDWWRALRGVPGRGVWIPGALCVGTRRHQGGEDFLALRPGRPVVCLELRPPSPFRLLALSAPDPRATARSLLGLAPRIDASVRWRQPLPVPTEQAPPQAADARRAS